MGGPCTIHGGEGGDEMHTFGPGSLEECTPAGRLVKSQGMHTS
jgi:hypothetical protein